MKTNRMTFNRICRDAKNIGLFSFNHVNNRLTFLQKLEQKVILHKQFQDARDKKCKEEIELMSH